MLRQCWRLQSVQDSSGQSTENTQQQAESSFVHRKITVLFVVFLIFFIALKYYYGCQRRIYLCQQMDEEAFVVLGTEGNVSGAFVETGRKKQEPLEARDVSENTWRGSLGLSTSARTLREGERMKTLRKQRLRTHWYHGPDLNPGARAWQGKELAGCSRCGAVSKCHLFLFEPVFRETGMYAPCRENRAACDSQLPSQVIHQLEEPASWLSAGGTGQEEPGLHCSPGRRACSTWCRVP